MAPPKRILAIKWRALGDTVLWSAALAALREHFPSAAIELSVSDAFRELYATDPRFQKVWTRSQASECHQQNFDLALAFHASPSAKRFCRGLRADKTLIHDHTRNQGGEILDQGKPQAAWQRDLNVVRTLGFSGAAPATRIHMSGLKAESPALPTVVLGALASRPAKQWPLENYAKLVAASPPSIRWLALAESPASAELLKSRLRQPKIETLCTPSLTAAASAIVSASAFVGTDSGLKHLAIALGKPTLTLFGPESAGEWHGYDLTRHPILQRKVGCRFHDPTPAEFAWCGEHICPLASHACLSLIQAEEVAEALRPLLQSHP